jgi:hypothetical protein
VHNKSSSLEVSSTPPHEAWCKPPLEWLKCNWDAALDNETKQIGMGVVVRNSEGQVVAALAMVTPFI